MKIVKKKGNLKDCGSKHGFTPSEIEEIRTEADNYKADGHDGPESIILAVGKLLDTFETQRQSVITQLRSQMGEGDDSTGNNADSQAALESNKPEIRSGTGEVGTTGATGSSVSKSDTGRDGNTHGRGDDGSGSLAGEQEPVRDNGPGKLVRVENPSAPHSIQRIGANPGNFVITSPIATGTRGQRLEQNLAAIRLVKQLDSENRYPTVAEQEVLSQYVGWGGLKKVFDTNSDAAQDQRTRKELETLLTPAEYDAAYQSTLDAHYTSQDVIESIYKVVRHLGFQGGAVLEPTHGTGNFIGFMPADMSATSKWYGSELDAITSKIGQYLYPDAQLIHSGFQNAEFPYGKFDLAIGNPPFGDQRIADTNKKRSEINRFKIHNYIIAKTGMHLKPGGVMAMVVTSRFLDTKNDEARSYLDKNFKFLSAIRLPNDAFAKNAGTEVTTDLVFFQKLMPGETSDYKGWLETGATMTNERGETVTLNKWFADHPDMMLGIPSMQGTMYGSGAEFTLEKREGQDIAAEIEKVIAGDRFIELQDIVKEKTPDQLDAAAINIQMNREDVGVGGYIKENGSVFMRTDDDAYGNMAFVKLSPTTPWNPRHAPLTKLLATLKPSVTPDSAVKIKQAVDDLLQQDAEQKWKFAETKLGEAIKQLYTDADKVYTGKASTIPGRAELQKKITSSLKGYELGAKDLERINGMLNLRELTAKLIEAERFDMAGIEDIRQQLNAQYDAFVKDYGFINDAANASLMADDIKLEFGLEHKYKKPITAAKAKTLKTVPSPATAEKAALMKGRVFHPVKEITMAANPKDAFNISLSEKGKIDIPYMAGLVGISDQEMIKALSDEGLIFQDPDTLHWIQEDEYLSGNVKAKYNQVLGRPGYEKNAERLKAVFPEDVATEDIFADLGQTWIDAKSYEEFLSLLGVIDPKVSVNALTGRVTMVNSGGIGTNDLNIMLKNDDYSVGELFNLLANKQAVVAYDKDSDGKKFVNKERTKTLAPIAKRIRATFSDWIFSDGVRAAKLTKIYNETQNTHSGRTYTGKRLKTYGSNPAISLRNSQKNAAWRMLQSPVTLLDHTVGAGKTMTIITGIMERKRLGLSRKPLVVVPNHLVGQWARDFLRLYPGANIMAATEKDFTKNNRRRLFARIATSKYDAIIIGHSSLSYIPLEKETEAEFAREELEYLKRAEAQMKDEEGEKSRSVRAMANRIAKKEQRIVELLNKERDDVASFEQMGIDYVALDESHEFKNLEYSSSMQAVAGMGTPKGAKKSFDLYSKIQYVIGKDGGAAFATGTPISNSLVEMYTILRYLNRKGLKDRNIDAFDSWVKSYASVESRIEYTSTQKLKERQVMASFNNLPELLQLYSEFADVVTMKDLKRIYKEQKEEENAAGGEQQRTDFPVPKVVNGGRQLDLEDATPEQKVYMDYLVARASRLEMEGRNNDPKTDNALWVMNDARKMALDIRLVDPAAPDDPNNKVNRAARRIKSIYDKWEAVKGTQIVFCDLSTPAKGAPKNAKKFITSALKKLGLEKHKTTTSILETMTYQEQWDFLRGKMEAEIDRLSELEDAADNEKEASAAAREREPLEKFIEEVDPDDMSALLTADVGFSVYDDLRKKLVDSGIPEKEIWFIHEADNPEKKMDLFAMVKKGDVRVLIGSSKKMGTGMNVQERAVALHHLDAPWRPSDVEQREGRVVRQNNKLYLENPDGFMVEIHAYSARNTFDSVMWQVLARKAEMLEQFRSGVRSFAEESSDSASYAEFMAESTGNPAFKEKFKLEREIEELEATERNISARRQSATGIMERKDASLAAAEKELAAADKDVKDLLSADGFMLDGKKYREDLAEIMTGLQDEYRAAILTYENETFPKFEAEKEKLRDKLGKKVEKGKMTEAEAKAELDEMKAPKAPTRPTVRAAAKKSETAKAIVEIEKKLEADDKAEVEIEYGSTQITITKSKYNDKGEYRYIFNINGNDMWSYGVTMKGVPENQLMKLFNDGVIRGHVAVFAANAKYSLDSLNKAIDNAEITLDKVKFDGKKDLEEKRSRYAVVVEEVNRLEQEMEARREDEFNKYLDKDRNRFPSGVFNSGRPRTNELKLTPQVHGTIDPHDWLTKLLIHYGEPGSVKDITIDGKQAFEVDLTPLTKTEDSDPRFYNADLGESLADSFVLEAANRGFKQLEWDEKNPEVTRFAYDEKATQREADQIKFSIRKVATGADKFDVDNKLTVFTANLDNAPPWEVVQSESDLPIDLVEQIHSLDSSGYIRGVFSDGKVYIIADNLNNFDEAVPVFLHEAVGHYGLRGLLGKKFDTVLQQIVTSKGKEGLREIATRYKLDLNTVEGRLTAAEEMLAEMAETNSKPGFVNRVIAMVRDWLRNHGVNVKWSDNDIRSLIARGKGYIERTSDQAATLYDGDKFSYAKSPDISLYGDDPVRWSIRTKPAPKNTIKAYKLFALKKSKPGQVFPLFVDADQAIDFGVWLDADVGELTANGKVKSKLGPLAYRPGWHMGDLPLATHIGEGGQPPVYRPEHQIWAEVEVAADRDWQSVANERGRNKAGKIVPVKAHITDQVPEDGYYRYKTNPNMTGNWIISGAIKVNRILTDEEVAEINSAAGVADLPRRQPLDLSKYGFKQESEKKTTRFSIRSVDPDVEARYQAAKGLGDTTPTLKERMSEMVDAAIKQTQHFPKLDMTNFAGKRTANILRVFESSGTAAKARTVDYLQNLTKGFNEDKMELFTRAIILGDLMNEAARGHKLPFGYTPQTLLADHAAVRAALQNHPDVQDAITRRRDMNREMVLQLVDNGLLPVESVLKDSARQTYINTGKYTEADINTDYYRHQVLAHAAAQRFAGVSTAGDVRNRKRGWQKQRQGSELDINTNFLEAEFEWFSQSTKELATKKALDEVLKINDISAELKAEAKTNGIADWHDLIPDDYTTWQPVKGSVFYRGRTLSEEAVTQFIAQNPAFADVADQFRSAMIRGGKRYEAIIPVGLAETLDNLRDNREEILLDSMNKKLIGAWKINTLLNPHRVIKYNINNMSGDMDAAIAADPTILKYMWTAFRNAVARKRGRELTQLDKDMIDRGVLDAGISINEIPDINKLPGFKHLSETARNTKLWDSIKSGRLSAILPNNLVAKYFDFVSGWTQVREGLLREAAYLRAKELLDQGKQVYWASDAMEINSIPDNKDKAAKLSRELLGDYGNLSAHGEKIRTSFVPFWSWMEINAPRYYRIFKNASVRGESNVGRMTGLGAKKVIGGTLGVAEKVLLVQLLFALVSLYNRMLWPEEEEALGENGRKQLHIILGKTSDGKTLTVRFQGAFSDVLSWFGLEDYPSVYRKYAEGKMDKEDIFLKMAKAMPNKIFNASAPFFKLAGELAFKKSAYPDVFKPTPIRDRKEHIARFFTFDQEYKSLAGKPTKGYLDGMKSTLIYESDPGEQAYNAIRKQAMDYMEKHGKEIPMGEPTKRSNALYYMRQAKRMGDKVAEAKYLELYKKEGGKRSGITESIHRAAPLAALPTNLRYKFRNSLSAADRETLDRANSWYREVYKK